MKKIEDYLHLYLGCECVSFNMKGILTPKLLADKKVPKSKIKPILRPLSDMTEEEGRFVVNHYTLRGVDMPINKRLFGIELSKRLSEQMEVATYLLSKHFDLFGLIEAGLVIDKTKINS